MAVSLSLASIRGSVPVGYQLYLPKDWAADPVRRKKAGVPDDVTFATKLEIALAQMREALASGVPMGVVLANAGYGYQELKQEFGLAHYEGRGWRGFHQHATLCIAAYAFLVTERLSQDSAKKTVLNQKRLPYPKVTCLAAARRVQRHVPDSISTLRLLIARAITSKLPRCPCCWDVRLHLRHSKSRRMASCADHAERTGGPVLSFAP